MLFKCSTCESTKEFFTDFFEDERLCPTCKTHTMLRPDMQELRNKIDEAFRSKAKLR